MSAALPGLALAVALSAAGLCAAQDLAQNGAQNGAPALQPAAPPVAQAQNGLVVIGSEATLPLGYGDRRFARVSAPPTTLPVLSADMTGPGHRLLRRLYETGQAAGNHGDLYDNRDRLHSRLDPLSHPQLTHIRYGAALRAEGVDYGLALGLLFDHPVIGNSSTALAKGPLWRSQPRLAMTAEKGAWMQQMYRNYRTGQIHVYPEHRDHDPERGDLFPANTPYMLISQGSSGSDQPHLEALAMILAALRPDTKARAMEEGLLAPLTQMIYRRARRPVRSRAEYLSGLAHPSAFRAADISLARMVSLANAIRPDELPPMVALTVLEETHGREGVDYYGRGLGETLFDTPSAIARIWRSRAGRRVFRLSAADTKDPNGRDLTFDWTLLRGDPDRVTITPSESGDQAVIAIDWQQPRPAPGQGQPPLTSARIDIGVFANNGLYDSAPAFLSVYLPAHETRRYAPQEAGLAPPRPLEIDRRRGAAYVDPLIFPVIDWRDAYQYDAQGAPMGWVRDGGGETRVFDAQGQLLPESGGAPIPMGYRIERRAVGRARVVPTPAPQSE